MPMCPAADREESRFGSSSLPCCSSEYWVLVRGFSLSHHNEETIVIVFTIDPYKGNFKKSPKQER